jgi:hypothetical protein
MNPYEKLISIVILLFDWGEIISSPVFAKEGKSQRQRQRERERERERERAPEMIY